MIKVLIVDDHPMVARYTKGEVLVLRPNAVVATARDLSEAVRYIETDGTPDFVLLDLMLPDCSELEGFVRVRELAPRAIVAIVSGETNPEVMRDCFAQGARGYLTKSTGADEFTEALCKLFENGFYYPVMAVGPFPSTFKHRLTTREIEVLRVLALGEVNKQLAPRLSISESTFKTYLRNIYEKLGVRTRVAAVRRGVELGLIETRRRE